MLIDSLYDVYLEKYVCIYTHTHTHIYIYIWMDKESFKEIEK